VAEDEDDKRLFEGALPENAVPVHSFAVGYGEVAAADEDGVTALPMVTSLTTDGAGPMLLWSLDSAVRLIGVLGEAVPKSVARFDPDFAKTAEEAKQVLERTRRAQERNERGILLGYLAAIGIVLLIGAIGVGTSGAKGLGPAWDMLSYVLVLLGVTYLVKMIAIEAAHWMNRRDKKKRDAEG
jgi:urease gamma subunit